MSDEITISTAISPELQPDPAALDYDLEHALAAIVTVRSRVPDDAFTAQILGTERAGHAVRIDDNGLLVTIGYVIAEAEEIWLIAGSGETVPGHVVGYDYETGFGLIQTLGRMALPTLELGDSAALYAGQSVVVAGAGGLDQALTATVVEKREFAGYWEYVLDEAIFTAPPHPNWGGAALLGHDGRLAGIGSLYVENLTSAVASGNMVVPINILKPVMAEMLQYGTTLKPARPWLGIFVTEADDSLVVAGVLDDGPAQRADVRTGDVIIGVDGQRAHSLAQLFRTIWAYGEAGSRIPLVLYRDGAAFDVYVDSIDRRAQFKSPDLH